MKSKYLTLVALACAGIYGIAQNNIAEEVAWVVGDEPIYKSQIEEQYSQAQYEGTNIEGNPYCVIPERLAIEKLYLHQVCARMDMMSYLPEPGNLSER